MKATNTEATFIFGVIGALFGLRCLANADPLMRFLDFVLSMACLALSIYCAKLTQLENE